MEASNYPAVVNSLSFNNEESRKVLESKTYVGKTSKINFDSPEEMLTPVLEAVAPLADTVGSLDILLDASNAITNLNDDETENTAYGRVRFEARYGAPREFRGAQFIGGHQEIERFRENIGFIYAFDLGTPEVIVYHGTRAQSCLNLMIFGAQQVRKFNYVNEGAGAAQDQFIEFLAKADQEIRRQQVIIEQLMSTYWEQDVLLRNIGSLLKHVTLRNSFGQAALATTVRALYDPTNKYAVDQHGGTTAWNVLQALTQYVTDKGYLNVAPVKTVQMTDFILNLN